MWQALDNARLPVAPHGKLCIAIYNHTGSQSERWKRIKRSYNELPGFLRLPFTLLVIAPDEAKSLLRAMVRLRPRQYLESWTRYEQNRGMSRWHDIVDWVGGYPYEAAKHDEVFNFYRERGFTLEKLRSGGGLGCNEFVFSKGGSSEESH